MCSGSETEPCPLDLNMEAKYQPKRDEVSCKSCSKLLELSATDDLAGFISEVEQKGCDLNELSYWYGRRIGSRKMGFEERTPILIASMYGSTKVLNYLVQSGKIDVNGAYGSDGVTALHCAAVGGSDSSVEVVKMLLDAAADVNSLDANGNRPCDLVAPGMKSLSYSKRKSLEMLLKGITAEVSEGEDDLGSAIVQGKEGAEKKEYPIDVSLPDINNGLYGTDEFRMYSFKVKPCSRAYSHDWTECPFVHPGENARRRDPRKYHYSCVPCPDFKKGTCAKADACEYAHGVFESWLHPAQYRTRLCKDETGCARKVCFFAHKLEELRPLYASTGSAVPSPKSGSVSSMDMTTLSPLALGSSSLLMPTTSTPPMSPSAACSSPMSTSMWQSKMNLTPPTLQLPGSRLKTALNARDLELELELLKMQNIRTQQQQRQQLIDEMAGLASPSSWNKDYNRIGDLKPTNLDDVFGSIDPSLLSHLQSLSPRVQASSSSQMQSPTGVRMRQNMNQLRASYPSNVSSSPVRKSSPPAGFDTSAAVAAAVMNSRSSAFAKRSQSFIDRGAVNHRAGVNAYANSPTMSASNVADWGSPDGKLDWGFSGGDDLNKLRKSASFAYRNNGNSASPITSGRTPIVDEPDVSWVNSLVKDVPAGNAGQLFSSEQKRNGGFNDIMPSWIDQLYIEQEQMVA
ncbi:OLC1v1026826C1 [Oldenlandia corymbosa var. corymbosa]|uniref:OLC1v1026826C1 n=1 Tax=Oldenlandia corymbosa var. corymbosa TaxID=529605 RepID=A0AAV1C886_OLDCO|nr:OLC1v1026826C1 [Oldenlandia corymbosa var. corymbosa]